ncbi:hypothetical protein JEP66_01565 [Proteus mirabilis]|uniref:hypothetical protein n=1 Tax=Proteus mirabilis TaxID=584 RepID=UPI00163DCD6B|nr:hypothetical protein [Proteus mirabilis]EKU6779504.1 hypothetical protein [Proteus mirabilis]EKU7263564.1 hypothetical protein [Proteus mirabilis]EKV5075585.1 hypothetical protein [Proteus mirabilis]EKX6519647.1 hypothetical protein [Proteus mirabilis]ELB1132720.1 hypothetical protein [Proteus mirabilis]
MSKIATELHGSQTDESLAKKEIQSTTDVAAISRSAKLNSTAISNSKRVVN